MCVGVDKMKIIRIDARITNLSACIRPRVKLTVVDVFVTTRRHDTVASLLEFQVIQMTRYLKFE